MIASPIPSWPRICGYYWALIASVAASIAAGGLSLLFLLPALLLPMRLCLTATAAAAAGAARGGGIGGGMLDVGAAIGMLNVGAACAALLPGAGVRFNACVRVSVRGRGPRSRTRWPAELRDVAAQRHAAHAATLAAEDAQGGLPDPRERVVLRHGWLTVNGTCRAAARFCSARRCTDGLVGDGGSMARLQHAEVGDTMSIDGTPGGTTRPRAFILHSAPTLAPTPQTFDTTTALAAISGGTTPSTSFSGDQLLTIAPTMHWQCPQAGFLRECGSKRVGIL